MAIFSFPTSHDEEHWNVGFRWTFVEVDGADHDHADGNDNRNGAGDCAADRSQQQYQDLDQEVDEVP